VGERRHRPGPGVTVTITRVYKVDLTAEEILAIDAALSILRMAGTTAQDWAGGAGPFDKVAPHAEKALAACGLDRNQLGRLGKSLRHVVLRG